MVLHGEVAYPHPVCSTRVVLVKLFQIQKTSALRFPGGVFSSQAGFSQCAIGGGLGSFAGGISRSFGRFSLLSSVVGVHDQNNQGHGFHNRLGRYEKNSQSVSSRKLFRVWDFDVALWLVYS